LHFVPESTPAFAGLDGQARLRAVKGLDLAQARLTRGVASAPRRSPVVGQDASAAALLQARLGNAGTMALLTRLADGGTVQRASSPARESGEPATAAAGLLARGVLRPKLEVGAADDPLEREADSAAGLVVAGQSVGRVSRLASGSGLRPLQQQAEPEEVQERAQTVSRKEMEDGEEEEPIQRQTKGEPLGTESPVTEPDIGTAGAERAMAQRSAGSLLSPTIRPQMEQGFGADLSAVRVHADPAANTAAQALGARAFTHGSDIYLAHGESQTDRRLMAHELTHVVQQSDGAPSSRIQRQKQAEITAPNDLTGFRENPNKPVFEGYKGQSINKTGHVSAPHSQYEAAKTSGVNVRSKPNGTLPPIAKVIYGTEVHVVALDNTGAFYFIDARNGAVGWINRDYVALDPPDAGSRLHHVTESDLTSILKNEYVDKKL
jgi:hypothetical protein